MQGLNLTSGVYAEIIPQLPVKARVDLKSVGMPAAPVQCRHQCGREVLVIRMLQGEPDQFTDESKMGAIDQFGVNRPFKGSQTHLFPRRAKPLPKIVREHIGEQWPPPKRQCRAQLSRSLMCIVEVTGAGDQRAKSMHVDYLWINLCYIASTAAYQLDVTGGYGQILAQPRDVCMKRRARRARGMITPEQLNQSFNGNRRVGFQQQECEKAPFPPAPKGQRSAIMFRLEPSEQAKFHPQSSPLCEGCGDHQRVHDRWDATMPERPKTP